MSFLRTAPWGAACVWMAASAIASPFPVAPNETSAPPAVRDAVRRVWTDSPDVQAADAERRAATARARAAANPIYNPSLTVEGENADVDRRTVGASLTLDLGGKRRARMAEGEAAMRASEAGYTMRRRDVATAWLKAWSASLLAARQIDLGRRRVDLMRRFDELAAQRLAVGDIATTERDLAALALAEAELQQASLAAQEAAARAALAAVDAHGDALLPPLPSSLPPAAERWVPLAVADRPDVVEALAEQARADAGVAIALSARRPDPTVGLTGGSVRIGARSDRVVGVNVSIPLPVLNTGRAEVTAAHAGVDAAVARRQAIELRSGAVLEQRRATYAALRFAATTIRGTPALALDERAGLLERLWQAGEIGSSDYLVQLKQSLDTALSGVTLENQAWEAWFDYLSAAGRLDDWIDGTAQEASR
ncbi:TolC family protein [Luteibacter sp. NPDC031894]|uniref:TolC family protein n=1 Tax=Luteibacter sp. NPDC031894 TaxID=3390572 RepID=UPI003D0031D0